jgi:hypothetical protein
MMNNESLKNDTNSTDATSGQSLRVRVAARKAEIEAAIADPATDERTRGDLQSAASAVEGLLTGDLDRIPKVVASSLSAWLESNKHLGERHVSAPQVTESPAPCDIPEPPAVE